MLSEFHLWTETERRIFIAKLVNEMNYSQDRLDVLQTLLFDWEKNPSRQAQFFNTTNNINYGTSKN